MLSKRIRICISVPDTIALGLKQIAKEQCRSVSQLVTDWTLEKLKEKNGRDQHEKHQRHRSIPEEKIPGNE